MRFIACAALVVLTGCAPFKKTIIDPAFKVYVNKWDRTYPDYLVNDVAMKFSDIAGKTDLGEIVGECLFKSDDRTVLIDPDYWATYDEPTREELIFHELGHCVMGLQHNCSLIHEGGTTKPESIMYPFVFSYSDSDSGYYYNELRSSESNCP
jgi:hypothetical protein